MDTFNDKLQCNSDTREIFSGPKLEPVLPKQNIPNPDMRDLFSGPDYSLISGLHYAESAHKDLFMPKKRKLQEWTWISHDSNAK